MEDERFERSRSLLGEDAFARIASLRVAVFGVGGVGGWCAEALVRTGVRNLILVDDDAVAVSNINRQRQGNPSTIGRKKVEVLREMLLEIVPDAGIVAIPERYTPESAARFDAVVDGSDFVIDAIDSVDCKAHLIQRCCFFSHGAARDTERKANLRAYVPPCENCAPILGPTRLFSSMGAALRMDPTKVRVSPFSKITGDGLARALRNRFMKDGFPIPNHLCIHSEEPPCETSGGVDRKSVV